MRPSSRRAPSSLGAVAAAAFSAAAFLWPGASAHTWCERTSRIAANGTLVGAPGYDRAHVERGGSVPETEINWLIPPNGRADGKVIHLDDKIAKPSQRSLGGSSYSGAFPMLKVAPGDFVALQYQENGHVTGPDSVNPGKPINRGTVYLYGTTSNDLSGYNLVDIHLTWTADGTGGDAKGRLLATRNFDDSVCHQYLAPGADTEGISTYRSTMFAKQAENPYGVNQWCQSSVQIPFDAVAKSIGNSTSNTDSTVYTVIWVWDWPTMNETGVAVPPASYYHNSSSSPDPVSGAFVATPELYTSVVDFEVMHDPCSAELGALKGPTCGTDASASLAVDSSSSSSQSSSSSRVVAIDAAGRAYKSRAATYVRQTNWNVGAIRAQLADAFLVQVPQAGFDVAGATAPAENIPLARLVGVAKPAFPLATSILKGLSPSSSAAASSSTASSSSSVSAPSSSSSSSAGEASAAAAAATTATTIITTTTTTATASTLITVTVAASTVTVTIDAAAATVAADVETVTVTVTATAGRARATATRLVAENSAGGVYLPAIRMRRGTRV